MTPVCLWAWKRWILFVRAHSSGSATALWTCSSPFTLNVNCILEMSCMPKQFPLVIPMAAYAMHVIKILRFPLLLLDVLWLTACCFFLIVRGKKKNHVTSAYIILGFVFLLALSQEDSCAAKTPALHFSSNIYLIHGNICSPQLSTTRRSRDLI